MDEQDRALLLAQITNMILGKPVPEELKSNTAELQDLQEALSYLAGCLSENNAFLKNLSVGNLDIQPPRRHDFLAANLKELHAGLRHLTWQANQVAGGDYQQKVSFLGEFSDSFNQMVTQLEERENKLKEQTAALTESMDLLIAVMDGLPDWVLVTKNGSGEILYANHATQTHFYDAETALFHCGNLNCGLMKLLREQAKPAPKFEFCCAVNGRTMRARNYSIQWKGQSACVHLITDVTQEKNRAVQLEKFAFQDELTGLYNRRYCIQTLTLLLAKKTPFSLCLIDLDALKHVNDCFGHIVGDDYIRTVTATMQQFDSPASSMCRVGGDEFLMIFPDCSEAETREKVRCLSAKISSVIRAYPLAISYGILFVDGKGDLSPETVLTRVDEKMYAAKKNKAE